MSSESPDGAKAERFCSRTVGKLLEVGDEGLNPTSPDRRPKTEHFINANVLKTGLAGIYVVGNICNVNADLIIDSGASVSILNARLFSQIALEHRPKIQPFNDTLYLADGSELPVLGIATIPYDFDKKISVNHPTVIADIESDGLIGLDFMKRHDCELSYIRRSFTIQNVPLQFREEGGLLASCRITANQSVTIPPNSEFIVPGKVKHRGKLGPLGFCSVVEPISSLMEREGLVVGKALIDPSKGIVPICVANPFDEPKVISRNDSIAIAHPVTDVSAVEEGKVPLIAQILREPNSDSWDRDINIPKPDVETPIFGPLPAHLQNLLDKSSSDLR